MTESCTESKCCCYLLFMFNMVNLNKKAVDFDDRVMHGKLMLIILIESKSVNQHFCLQISISVRNMLLQHLKRCKYSNKKARFE